MNYLLIFISISCKGNFSIHIFSSIHIFVFYFVSYFVFISFYFKEWKPFLIVWVLVNSVWWIVCHVFDLSACCLLPSYFHLNKMSSGEHDNTAILALDITRLYLMGTSPKNDNPVIIYSSSCCSKTIALTFFCGSSAGESKSYRFGARREWINDDIDRFSFLAELFL